jgi:hypothetical protein
MIGSILAFNFRISARESAARCRNRNQHQKPRKRFAGTRYSRVGICVRAATDEVLEENGIKIHLIAQRSYRLATWYQYRKFLQQYLNRVIAADKIDLIEAPDWTGITAFMKINAPLVVRFHGSDAYFCHLEHRKQKMKNFVFEKLGIGKADATLHLPTSRVKFLSIF